MASRRVAELRAQKDLTEMDAIEGVEVLFPDADDLLFFRVAVTPLEGHYEGARFVFAFRLPEEFPFAPPRVVLESAPIFHPNIDWLGRVCLNVLREDWSPVLSISSVIFGLLLLFHEPNPAEPLNKDASDMLQENPERFRTVVRQTLAGGDHFGKQFACLLT